MPASKILGFNNKPGKYILPWAVLRLQGDGDIKSHVRGPTAPPKSQGCLKK
jgi:hypothetical protein